MNLFTIPALLQYSILFGNRKKPAATNEFSTDFLYQLAKNCDKMVLSGNQQNGCRKVYFFATPSDSSEAVLSYRFAL